MGAVEKKNYRRHFSFARYIFIGLVQFRCIYLILNQTNYSNPLDVYCYFL